MYIIKKNETKTNKKKYKPPSRERYEKNNPNWTVRMPKEWHIVVEVFLEELNLSRREFMAMALNIQEMNYEKAKTEGYKEGYDNGDEQGYARGKKEGFDKGFKKGHEVGFDKGHKEGLEEGEQIGIKKAAKDWYEKGKIDWQIWYFCASGGELIPIESRSDEHNFIIDIMRRYGWGHGECHDRFNQDGFYY